MKMRSSEGSKRKLIIQLSSDLSQVVSLEEKGILKEITPVPKGFKARHTVVITVGSVEVDGKEETSKYRNIILKEEKRKLFLHPTIEVLSQTALGRRTNSLPEILGGDKDGGD